MYEICVIPGDGIGQEVVPAALGVLEATGVPLRWVFAEAGWEAFQRTGTSVPAETLAKIKRCRATLAGAFSSPSRKVAGFFSAIRYLRRELDLYANLRPTRSRPLPGCPPGIDLLLVRENTEGLYVAQERRYGELAIADAVITRRASERIGRVACQQARRRRQQLTIVHKANVLPLTTGLFLETVHAVARDYPELKVDELIVDAAAMKLVRSPQQFDVLVTTNLFGDILSDLTAGLTGGLGLAPSANVGEQAAIFEPVHGSAPDIAGRGIANPMAAILSGAMMLSYLGETSAAERLELAVDRVLAQGPLTPDLGGSATTEQVAAAVRAAYEALR